jgi:hypothetical protein
MPDMPMQPKAIGKTAGPPAPKRRNPVSGIVTIMSLHQNEIQIQPKTRRKQYLALGPNATSEWPEAFLINNLRWITVLLKAYKSSQPVPLVLKCLSVNP